MFGDIKRRLVVTRAQGALAVADLALEQGDARRALGLYRVQARDLGARGVDRELEVRGWLGILSASSALLNEGEAPGDGLREALSAVSRLERGDLPAVWSRYDAFRDLAARLLARAPERAAELARSLCTFFPDDPRPHYVLARALDRTVELRDDADARSERALAAIDAYREALADAAAVGSRKRWQPVVHLRMAALLWRHRRGVDPEAAAKALELVQGVPREALAEAPAPYRLVVAQVWLGAGSAMNRLRALDTLESMVAEPELRRAALHVLDDYLETLGWGYYPTEQDRVRAIVHAVAPSLGPDVARRGRAYLDLLGRLHDSEGRRAAPSAAHLATLLELEREARGDTISAAYHEVALRLCQADPADFHDVLAEALEDHEDAARALWTRMLVEPLAVALGALCQLRRVDKGEVRQLLRALSYPSYQVPHVQDIFGLLFPTLITHWATFSDMAPLMIDGAERFIRLASRPSYGFSTVGLAMLSVGEGRVAAMAARRAMAERVDEPQEALAALLAGLARRALRAGEVEEAAWWLLGAQGTP